MTNLAGMNAPVADTRPPGKVKSSVRRHEETLVGSIPYLLLAGLVIWLAVVEPSSTSRVSITNFFDVSAVLILAAIGEAIIVIAGGIDVSFAGIISFVNVFAAVHMTGHTAAVGFGIMFLLLGWAPGVVNALLITDAKLPPLVATLGTWFVWSGLALYVLPNIGGGINASVATIATTTVGAFDVSVLVIVVAAIAVTWFMRSRPGLEIRAMGSDPDAARQRGVSIRQSTILAYGLGSYFAVLAGLLLSIQTQSGDPTVGNSYLLPVFAAIVIGGVSLAGGRGNPLGAILGGLVLTYVQTLIYVLGLNAQLSLIASGVLLIACVGIQQEMRRWLGFGNAVD